MFDVAFSELVVIGVVALVVIGPEKLPKVARTVGFVIGRMQRYATSMKAEIEREMQFEDLQKLQQEIQQGVQQANMQMQQKVQQLESQAQEIVESAHHEGQQVPSAPAEYAPNQALTPSQQQTEH